MIGSTRETTTLVLNEFKRQGSIEFLGRKIIIRKRAELESLLRREGARACRRKTALRGRRRTAPDIGRPRLRLGRERV